MRVVLPSCKNVLPFVLLSCAASLHCAATPDTAATTTCPGLSAAAQEHVVGDSELRVAWRAAEYAHRIVTNTESDSWSANVDGAAIEIQLSNYPSEIRSEEALSSWLEEHRDDAMDLPEGTKEFRWAARRETVASETATLGWNRRQVTRFTGDDGRVAFRLTGVSAHAEQIDDGTPLGNRYSIVVAPARCGDASPQPDLVALLLKSNLQPPASSR